MLIQAVLLAVIVSSKGGGAESSLPAGKVFLERSAGRFIRNCLRGNPELDSGIQGFKKMIDQVTRQPGHSDRQLRNFARDLDGFECNADANRDEFFFRLAVWSSRTPNLNILRYPGLFESPKRQALFARIVQASEKVGIDRNQMQGCLAWGMYDLEDGELESKLNEIDQFGDASKTQSFFLCGGILPVTRSVSVDRLFALLQTDLPEALALHGIIDFGRFANTFGERNFRLMNKLFSGKMRISQGDIAEQVVDGLIELAIGISSMSLELSSETRSFCAVFFDSMDQFFTLIESDAPTTEDQFSDLRDRLTHIIGKITETLPASASQLHLVKQDLLRHLEAAVEIDQAVKIALLPDVVAVIDRVISNTIRFDSQLAPEQTKRIIEVIYLIVDTVVQVIADGPGRYSRIALREGLNSMPRHSDALLAIFSNPDALVLNLAYRIGQDFGIDVLEREKIQSLLPEWSTERAHAVRHLINAKIYFGRDEESHCIKLAKAEESRLIKARDVVTAMAKNGVDGLQNAALIDPIDWAIEFISDPQSHFANWIADRFPLGQFRMVFDATSKKSFNEDMFYGFPLKFRLLSQRVNILYLNSEYDAHTTVSASEMNWFLRLPRRVMRLEIETGSLVYEHFALSLLELLEITLNNEDHPLKDSAQILVTRYATKFESVANCIELKFFDDFDPPTASLSVDLALMESEKASIIEDVQEDD